MLVLLICESWRLAVAAMTVGVISTWRWRAVVRLKMDTFVMVSILRIGTAHIVFSDMKQPMIYEFAVVRGWRREWHFADGHLKNSNSEMRQEILAIKAIDGTFI